MGYALIPIDMENDPKTEQESLRRLIQLGVDGLIWIPQSEPRTVPLPVSTILLDRPADGFITVSADHYQGGQMLAAYAQKLNHQRIGLLSGPQHLFSARRRRQGLYDDASELDIIWDLEVPFSIELHELATQALLRRDVTLVVCGNNTITIGAIRFLKEQGVRIPEDVSIVGFDDVPWGALLEPALTTIRQPLSAIGTRAIEVLHKCILDPTLPCYHETLPVELVVRSSAGELQSEPY